MGSELSDSDSVLDDPESLNQFTFQHEPDDSDMHTESSVSDDQMDSD